MMVEKTIVLGQAGLLGFAASVELLIGDTGAWVVAWTGNVLVWSWTGEWTVKKPRE